MVFFTVDSPKGFNAITHGSPEELVSIASCAPSLAPPFVTAFPSASIMAKKSNMCWSLFLTASDSAKLRISSDLSSSKPVFGFRIKCLMSRLAGPFALTTAPSNTVLRA